MAKVIDYYLSLNSPWAYLGGRRLAEITARHRATVRVKPVDYGEIFPETGGLPLAKRAPARQAYRLTELRRWSRFLEVPLNLQPKHFPAAELTAAGMVIAAGDGGDPLALANAIGRALWAEERDIADTGTLQDIAGATGHDGVALLAAAGRPAVSERYRALTREALARGVFGAPTYVFEEELYWGQDRLDFLDRALGTE